MDTKTREALEASIKHWEENVAAETPNDANTGWRACALCNLFFFKGCDECPVVDWSGERACKETPYLSALHALRLWRNDASDIDRRDAWRTAAQAELDFLISLRPEVEA